MDFIAVFAMAVLRDGTLKAFQDNVGNMEIKKVQISPVSAIVEYDTLSDEKAEFEDVSLKLKNGSQVGWSAMSWDTDDKGVSPAGLSGKRGGTG